MMAKRILVPVTQTPPAASFVAALGDLARGAGATVRLLHVAPPTSNVVDADDRIVAYADQETARVEADARDFLETVRLDLDGVPVESAVRFGEPVREILAEAGEFGADFIVLPIGARRRRTLRRGVAGRLLRRAEVPVALLRPARHEADAR
jgi:nucleotide-binding universal stress UspA family protein